MNDVELIERLTVVEQSAKSAHKRLDELHELTNAVCSMASELKHMREDVNRLSDELQAVRDKPMKRYDLFITAAISALASGIVGYLLSMIF